MQLKELVRQKFSNMTNGEIKLISEGLKVHQFYKRDDKRIVLIVPSPEMENFAINQHDREMLEKSVGVDRLVGLFGRIVGKELIFCSYLPWRNIQFGNPMCSAEPYYLVKSKYLPEYSSIDLFDLENSTKAQLELGF